MKMSSTLDESESVFSMLFNLLEIFLASLSLAVADRSKTEAIDLMKLHNLLPKASISFFRFLS